jgi:ferredoxin-NADP reductase
VARAAVLGRLSWLAGEVTALRDETATARTIVLSVPGWRGHAAGQHVDVRLTAEDGYSAQRSYSIASAPDGTRLELTVQRVSDGEVSPYLAGSLVLGQPVELRGPIGGWFIWEPGELRPVLLIAGGSGIVPLMSMIRAREQAASAAPFRLVYSVRGPGDIIYGAELAARAADAGLSLTYVYTRTAPPDARVRVGRISGPVLAAEGWRGRDHPAVFACGPTGFVEAAASLLTRMGHDASAIKTERFGPSGG